MTIQVLPEHVVAKIAAGEVVERPASVVKELVENAIDAGATEIKVEIREGGRRLIRVIDDGAGIPTDQVELAFERHATSKVLSDEDLARVESLGFRGEALPSIAAVSQVTAVTLARGEDAGTRLRLDGGEVLRREKTGAAQGTTITVENLFYNTPARRKFLRTVTTESRHITDLVTRYAMAYPEIRFALLNGGRVTFQAAGTGKLRDVLIQVYGLDTTEKLLPVETAVSTDAEAQEGPRVTGCIGPPSLHRSNSRHITFFVNRRWIQDRSLSYAVSQAYHTLLPKGRYPLAVLDIEMEPEHVDVNVHPTKREVRFLKGQRVFAAVQRAVRRTLVDQAPVRRMGTPGEGQRDWERRQRVAQAGRGESMSVGQLGMEVQRTADADTVLSPERAQASELPPLRVLGQVAAAYIIAEGPQGLYLIDQHAAHERVLYERMRAERVAEDVASQALLQPAVVELTPAQKSLLEEQLDLLSRLGFEIEVFGPDAHQLRSVPEILKGGDPAQALPTILDMLEEGDDPLDEERESRVIASICKQAAVKAGQTLSHEEMSELVRRLEQTTMPRTCPHGRPTMIHLSQAQLEREFGRR